MPLHLDRLIPAIEQASLTERQKRDMTSAVRSVFRLADIDPENTSLDLLDLREILDRLATKNPDLSKGRIANLRSLFGKALALITPVMEGRNRAALLPEWQVLSKQLMFRDQTRLGPALRYLSARGIAPDTVQPEDLEGLRDTYLDLSLRARREGAWDRLAGSWNVAVKSLRGWPQINLPQEFSRRAYGLEWAKLPATLRYDVLNMLDNWPGGPLSPKTREIYEYRLRSAASILVRQHYSLHGLRGISDLVEFERFSRILRYLTERHDDEPGPAVHQMARFLLLVAQVWLKVPEPKLEGHRLLAQKLRAHEAA